jgi:hypothetical protein
VCFALFYRSTFTKGNEFFSLTTCAGSAGA